MNGWVKLIVVGALVGVIYGVYAKYYRASDEPTYETLPLARGDIDATISATGTCNAVVTVQVGSLVSGNIKALYADYNTKVNKGQLIAKIDPDTLQAKVDQAQANLDSAAANVVNSQASMLGTEADYATAQANVENQKANVLKAQVSMQDAKSKLDHENELFKRGIVAQEERDTAQATYDTAGAGVAAAQAQEKATESSLKAAQAQIEVSKTKLTQAQAQQRVSKYTLDSANIDLRNTDILAPTTGTVVSRKMDVGQTVAASFSAPEIFEIAQDLTKMQVIASIDESYMGQMRTGEPVTFTVEAYPGENFHGSVTQIRQEPNTVSNVVTYDAVIDVSNKDLKLFPGMTATVKVEVDHRSNVLKVPNTALRVRIEEPKDAAATPTATASATQSEKTPKSPMVGVNETQYNTRGGAAGAARGSRGGSRGGAGERRGGGEGRGGPGGMPKPGVAGAPTEAPIWVLGEDNKPREAKVLLGITDNNYTEVREVLSGELKEDDPVIVAVIPAKGAAPVKPASFPGMGGGRRF